MEETVEAVLGVKLEDCENAVKYAAIIYGAGAEDDRGLDMTAFSASKLFFSEGVFAFIVLGFFLAQMIFIIKIRSASIF